MRLLFFAYFFVEVLAFIGVAQLIGIGWAFLAVFALMLLGGMWANIALRNSLRKAAEGQSSIGSLAGDSAILVTAAILTVIPGFVTSVIGLLMVFGPTRALMRHALTTKARRAMEDFGIRAYSASPMAQYRTSYGTFTVVNPPAESEPTDYIDAEELEEIFRMKSAEPGRRSGEDGESGTGSGTKQ